MLICKEFAKLFYVLIRFLIYIIFMAKLSIENPHVPGSIPGRGTTYQEALIRNGRGFFVSL
tara:strand:- start:1117 stop:1299 length:183 start_codon:yes stop_codon:yes gene_type:complete